MSYLFEVTVKTNRVTQTYTIRDDHRSGGANVRVAKEGLQTFESHGHSAFPYGDHDLTVTVVKLDEPGR